MNFYKRHLGDIAKSLSNLSQGQMGAYDLLLDWMYANEQPLPLRMDEVYQIGRCRSKIERENVDRALEYFDLTEHGYTQKRAEKELAAWRAQAETNRLIAADREAKKRARKEHDSLNDSSGVRSTNGQPSQNPESRIQNPEASERASQLETSKGLNTHRASASALTPATTAAGEACRAMRDAGLATTNANHPEFTALVDAGATPAQFAQAAATAVSKGKGFAYALGVLRGQLADAASPPKSGKGDPEAIHERNRAVAADWLNELQAAGETIP